MSLACARQQRRILNSSQYNQLFLLLTVIFLQLASYLVSANPIDLSSHVQQPDGGLGNAMSNSIASNRTLTNRCSNKMVRLLPQKKMDARGKKKNRHSELLITSVYFGGSIYIQSAWTKQYLCFNAKGKLKIKHSRDDQCIFVEEAQRRRGTYKYRSKKYPNYFLGFNKKGRKLIGDMQKSGKREKCYEFRKSNGPRSLTQKGNRNRDELGNGNFNNLQIVTTTHATRHGHRRNNHRRQTGVT